MTASFCYLILISSHNTYYLLQVQNHVLKMMYVIYELSHTG